MPHGSRHRRQARHLAPHAPAPRRRRPPRPRPGLLPARPGVPGSPRRWGGTFRVKGRGVPKSKGAGDLLGTVEVAVPAKLSADERKAVEALAAASGESPRAHLGV